MSRALLIIDVQESFRQRPIWRAVSDPKIADHLLPVVKAARAAGDEVIWVLHSEPGTGSTFDPESGFVAIMPPLVPEENEPVLTKTSHNAFTTTNLQQLLTSRGVTEVLITGLRTEQCCETTARLASDLGYRVTFILDGTATNPIPDQAAPAGQSVDEMLADPRTLTAAEIMDRTRYVLAGRFAAVCSIAEVLEQYESAPR
ncbi:MAG: isochorismatase family protein [Nocardiopsaceae bacterium]|jgi:nicotinamidase-related amidase|nr:isochorismatase family protein [Nocardiopsaceae bacterium]